MHDPHFKEPYKYISCPCFCVLFYLLADYNIWLSVAGDAVTPTFKSYLLAVEFIYTEYFLSADDTPVVMVTIIIIMHVCVCVLGVLEPVCRHIKCGAKHIQTQETCECSSLHWRLFKILQSAETDRAHITSHIHLLPSAREKGLSVRTFNCIRSY